MNEFHLVIVCCHAIWLGGPTAGKDESEWLIEGFQQGETPTFVQHIKRGIEILAKDPHALLVFSGGATKVDRTPKTEAESYHALALARDLFNLESEEESVPIRDRIFDDIFATDSYQNLLFPLLQFPYFASKYLGLSSVNDPNVPKTPSTISVITHEFKRNRFLNHHRPAIKIPEQKLVCIGINPPMDEIKAKEVEHGESTRGVLPFLEDPYGVGPVLGGKRRIRGWSSEHEATLVNLIVEESQKQFLRWNGGADGKQIFPTRLPWEDL